MKLVLHPTYFPNIANFKAIISHDITWEVSGNYQKQTLRNRCYISTDRGEHMLTIPIKHVGSGGKRLYKDIKLDNKYPWQRQHWRTLETAYRTSPYFEYYEDDILPLYTQKFDTLLEFNLKTIAIIFDCLQLDIPTKRTTVFEKKLIDTIDARLLAKVKNGFELEQEEYVQVFSDRNDFVKNCSILDLLFNEGTNTLTYLNNQKINF
ncbi:MAG: WbqC family protein [Cellulophaga sp.]